jgi:hypothetical protein
MIFDSSCGRIRVVAINAVVVSSIALGVTRAAIAAPVTGSLQRVRSTNALIRTAIDGALERSRTFRGLIETIGTTDGIVYVEQGVCGQGVRACLVLWVVPAGGYRFLRILVDTRTPVWDLMESIGHELQHAVEVLTRPGLVSPAALYLFFARPGETQMHPLETAAAVTVGFTVRKEIEAYGNKVDEQRASVSRR